MRIRVLSILTTELIAASVLAAAPAASGLESLSASQLPDLLRVAAETTTPSYDRDLFEHWSDADFDGCNTRYEVLIAESTTPVSVGAGCTLSGGTWVSPYDEVVATAVGQLEIDHVVALAEAWRSGASAWTDAQREAFANDLDFAGSLVASSSTANQAKADKDPAEWLPVSDAYTCRYVTDWALVKYRWSLAVDEAEAAALRTVLSGACGASAVELPAVALAPDAEPTPAPSPAPVPAPDKGVVTPLPLGDTRLAGASRFETAVAASQRYEPNVPYVFVASGMQFPDALSAAAAAAKLGGPLLLTAPASLPASVTAEIARLKPARIIVVGGTASVSASAFAQLSAYAPTTRVGGVNRYETGLRLVAETFDASTTAFLASGRAYPDALAATGAAGKLAAPVLLLDGLASSAPSTVIRALRDLGVTDVRIAGGTGAVSAGVESSLRARGFTVRRYAGADRYATAAVINNAVFPAGSTDTTVLAAGTNFPDALAGAALAGRLGAPLFITGTACVPEPVKNALAALGADRRVVMGSTSVVSAAASANLGCLSAGRPSISGTVRIGGQLVANPGSWTAGTALAYQWLANGSPIGGGNILNIGSNLAGKRISVRVTGTKPGYVAAAVRSGETVAVPTPAPVQPAPRPTRTTPIPGTWNCPAWAPIKGNASSMIYHLPGGQYYDRTKPEECFATEAAAQAAHYRRSQR